jgi:hypothetical protein
MDAPFWSGTSLRHRDTLCLGLALLLISGCSTFTGYAQDPATDTRLSAELRFGFEQGLKDEYIEAAGNPDLRREIRDKIIYRQLSAYDLEFSNFERTLASSNNAFSLSSDTAVLALGATGAVVGGATTKAALAAASAFIVGTKTAVDKDLFYQAALPALIAQMESRRLEARVPIIAGLAQPDSNYPLQKALTDLGAFRVAASFGAAISSTIEDAGVRTAAANLSINTMPATIAYKAATPERISVRARLRLLLPDKALLLAAALEPTLQNSPAEIQGPLLQLDPTKQRLKDGAFARQFLMRWANADLNDAASVKQWTDQLDRIQ